MAEFDQIRVPGEKKPLTPGDKTARGCGFGCLGIIALLGVLFAVGAAMPDTPDGPNKFEAITYCEDRIETMLKAPATAEFSSRSNESNPFTVTGTVDSQNSFGALVRSSFECSVDITGDSFTVDVNYLD